MALEHQTTQAQQACAIVAGGIQSLRNSAQRTLRQQRTQHIQPTLLELGDQHPFNQATQALGGFQGDITNEAIAHDDIGSAFENVIALDIAIKIDQALLMVGTQ